MDIIILVFAVLIVVGMFFFNRLWQKGEDAIERKLRSGKAASEDEQLKTVLTFMTPAHISYVRQAIAYEIVTDQSSSGLFGRRFLVVVQDSEQGIAWQGGKSGDTFRADLVYNYHANGTTATYYITNHSKHFGVSSCIEVMSDLRNGVIRAFQRVDPNVYIQTSYQDLTHKMDWF